MINLKDISKCYKSQNSQTQALDNISLNVEDGQWVCICGPSGSGKSTLLKVLSGLEKADDGQILVNDYNLMDLNEEQKAKFRLEECSIISQDSSLVSYLNALENICLSSILKKEQPDWEKGKDILSRLNLCEKQHSFPDQLSGGEAQRIAIGRALYSNNTLILADEPTGNLDPANRDEFLDVLSSVKGDNQTIIMVTHDSQVANRASRVIRLEKGRIVQDGEDVHA